MTYMLLHNFYRDDGAWYVALFHEGEQVDEAGPFDDEIDAELAACRAVQLAS